jgi:uncharacterized membrane protein (DUF106 family)
VVGTTSLDDQKGELFETDILVRHLIEVSNVRVLITTKIHEMLVHHIIRGFDYKKFRKTDFIDMEHKKRERDFLKEYRRGQEIRSERREMDSQQLKRLKKEAFVAIVCTDLQISCQNEISKSQLLFAF